MRLVRMNEHVRFMEARHHNTRRRITKPDQRIAAALVFGIHVRDGVNAITGIPLTGRLTDVVGALIADDAAVQELLLHEKAYVKPRNALIRAPFRDAFFFSQSVANRFVEFQVHGLEGMKIIRVNDQACRHPADRMILNLLVLAIGRFLHVDDGRPGVRQAGNGNGRGLRSEEHDIKMFPRRRLLQSNPRQIFGWCRGTDGKRGAAYQPGQDCDSEPSSMMQSFHDILRTRSRPEKGQDDRTLNSLQGNGLRRESPFSTLRVLVCAALRFDRSQSNTISKSSECIRFVVIEAGIG